MVPKWGGRGVGVASQNRGASGNLERYSINHIRPSRANSDHKGQRQMLLGSPDTSVMPLLQSKA